MPTKEGHKDHSEDDKNFEEGEDEQAAGTSTEYSFISKQLDIEMRQLVQDYQRLKTQNDNKSDMYLRRIRLKHPIFHLLSNSAFKFIMDNGFLFKLKETQTVYKESQPARANIYFVLYG